MTELPKITKKQQAILRLLYCFRFLNRVQLQAFLHHKDPKTINLWLRDLRAKGYVEWIYSTKLTENSKPAIYYLALGGVRYLRTVTRNSEDEDGEGVVLPAYPPKDLRKRYKDPTRSQTYIDRCILIAACCLVLQRENTANEDLNKKLRYYSETEAEYLLEYNYFHFILGILDRDKELIHPNLIFCQDKLNKDGQEETTLESYILEIFDVTLPRYRLRKRLGDYVKFLNEEGDTWQEETATVKLPVILLVCPTTTELTYAKRRTRKLIADRWYWEDDDIERPRVRFTTAEKLKRYGLLAKEIWEQV